MQTHFYVPKGMKFKHVINIQNGGNNVYFMNKSAFETYCYIRV